MSTTCCVSCCFVPRLTKAVVVFAEDLFRVEADCSPVCCGVCATLAVSSIFTLACAVLLRNGPGQNCGFLYFFPQRRSDLLWMATWSVRNEHRQDGETVGWEGGQSLHRPRLSLNRKNLRRREPTRHAAFAPCRQIPSVHSIDTQRRRIAKNNSFIPRELYIQSKHANMQNTQQIHTYTQHIPHTFFCLVVHTHFCLRRLFLAYPHDVAASLAI